MSGKTPAEIKLQVLKCWLSGLSRDDISINIGISTGRVSNIIKECRNYKDIELFRSVAVKMKNQGLELNDLASSLALKNMLHLLELPDERLEKFLQALSIIIKMTLMILKNLFTKLKKSLNMLLV